MYICVILYKSYDDITIRENSRSDFVEMCIYFEWGTSNPLFEHILYELSRNVFFFLSNTIISMKKYQKENNYLCEYNFDFRIAPSCFNFEKFEMKVAKSGYFKIFYRVITT